MLNLFKSFLRVYLKFLHHDFLSFLDRIDSEQAIIHILKGEFFYASMPPAELGLNIKLSDMILSPLSSLYFEPCEPWLD